MQMIITRVFLVLTALFCLGTSFSAVAGDTDSLKNAEFSEMKAYHPTPLLTAEDITDSYYKGLDAGATHMLIVWDTFDFEDSYDFVVYSYPEQDVNDLVHYFTAPGFYRVSAVYAMHLDINEQLSERNGHPWHTEYSDPMESQERVMGHKHCSILTNGKN